MAKWQQGGAACVVGLALGIGSLFPAGGCGDSGSGGSGAGSSGGNGSGASSSGGGEPAVCTNDTPCAANSDCPDGYRCNFAASQCTELFCGSRGTSCTDIDHCQQGLTCLNSVCDCLGCANQFQVISSPFLCKADETAAWLACVCDGACQDVCPGACDELVNVGAFTDPECDACATSGACAAEYEACQ